MNIYNKLNNDIKDQIDFFNYKNYVKPVQDLLITELVLSFIPKCIICSKPLIYINWYGYNEYFYQSHELCIKCYNEESDYESDTTYYDYDSDETCITMDTIESIDYI